MEVDDSWFCAAHDRASKWTAALQLHKEGLINDLMWCHDFDAYQLVQFDEDEPRLNGAVAGFTDYGWQDRWNTGSVFFLPEAMDIIEAMVEITTKNEWSEEAALGVLTDNNVGNINDRIKRLNITYNYGYATQRKMNWNANIVDNPIRVAHFHPSKRGRVHRFAPLMPSGLLRIMADHGYAP